MAANTRIKIEADSVVRVFMNATSNSFFTPIIGLNRRGASLICLSVTTFSIIDVGSSSMQTV